MATNNDQLMKEVAPLLVKKILNTPECLKEFNKTIKWTNLLSINIPFILCIAAIVVACFIIQRFSGKILYHINAVILFWLYVCAFVLISFLNMIVIGTADWAVYKMVKFEECDVFVFIGTCSLIRKTHLFLADFINKVQFAIVLERLVATILWRFYEKHKRFFIVLLIICMVATSVHAVYIVYKDESVENMKTFIPTNCLSLPSSGLFSFGIALETMTLLFYVLTYCFNNKRVRSQIGSEITDKTQAHETLICIRHMAPEVFTTGVFTLVRVVVLELVEMNKDYFERDTFELIGYNFSVTQYLALAILVQLYVTLRRSQKAQEKNIEDLVRSQQQVDHFAITTQLW